MNAQVALNLYGFTPNALVQLANVVSETMDAMVDDLSPLIESPPEWHELNEQLTIVMIELERMIGADCMTKLVRIPKG